MFSFHYYVFSTGVDNSFSTFAEKSDFGSNSRRGEIFTEGIVRYVED